MSALHRWPRTGLPVAVALGAAPLTPARGRPESPVRFVVPYPPGGGSDVIARSVQERFARLLGQPIAIDNRDDAAGSPGTDIVADVLGAQLPLLWFSIPAAAHAIFVPAKTSQRAVDRLNRALNTLLDEPEIRERALQRGAEGTGGTLQLLGQTVTAAMARRTRLAKDANIHLD